MPEQLEYAILDADDVLKRLKTPENGLSEKEAKRRLAEFGRNVIAETKKLSMFVELLSHFKNPLILILLAATAVSAYFGQTTNAVIISLIVLFSVILDFFEEHHAGRAVQKLKESIKMTATVIRDGVKKEVHTSDICVGDIVFLSAGDLVPADARIVSCNDFFLNQAALTGESFPVEKQERKSSEMNDMVFAGTNVVSGSATVVVVAIGKNTEFGRIAEKLVKPASKSEFEIGITSFGFFIMKIMFFLVLFIFLFNSLVRHRVLESFLFAVAIAVGITPELLPMIMSVTMAKGSLNMAKKGTIVKTLVSIPNFGSMDVLCTDKTGTLTEGKIALVSSTDLHGKLSDDVFLFSYLNSFYQTGIKNPLDDSILSHKKLDVSKYRKIDEIPFDFSRKRLSVVVEKKNRFLITKGAPETVFDCCSFYMLNGKKMPLNEQARMKAIKYYHELSSHGYRVLAVAVKKPARKKKYTKNDESDLELLGFVSFLDPPKADVKVTLEEIHRIGVEVKVLTGDNELVAEKVCQDVGLKIKGILIGHDISSMSDEALKRKVEDITIFARFSPDEKNRVIIALRANGHVVGYLGDGINDASSMKSADVGISVNNAVDVARESAEIVLTHKSLRILKEGILEGRKAFGNTMKYIMMGFSSNFGNMFSAAGAVVFLPFLPMLPIQILLNNFIYDFSQVTIPTDNVDKEWVQQSKRWNIQFIKKFMYVFGPISSLFDFATFFVLFYLFNSSASVFQTGWFIESLATQTLVIHVIRTKKIPFVQSWPSPYLLVSSIACVFVGWVLPFTSVGAYFGFVPLPAKILVVLAGIVLVYLFVVQFVKQAFYKRFSF
ncbi:putative copper-exporting P-type ATPase A [uncultured archaeon]|nr:putative copper-exporting P-type ATPase A [uncultured archaeon]